jgi:hypothetical protein
MSNHICTTDKLIKLNGVRPEISDIDSKINLYDFEMREYGEAFDVCWEEKGKLFVSNNEYSNQVNFCPYCGYKAEIQVERKES